jgi:hypothetical protein
MTRSDWRFASTRCGPAIRKDDPAKHLDKLIAAGDGRKTPGIVAPLELARAEKMQHTI